jgi:Phage tail lysozyme
MATIIDALLVTLGLDSSGLKKGAAEAGQAQEKIEKDANKAGASRKKRDAESSAALKKQSSEESKAAKEREAMAKRTADGLSKLRNEVLGVAAAFFGMSAVTNFGEKLIGADANLSRLSGTLGVSEEDLKSWEGAASEFNVSAQQMEGTFRTINKFQQGLKSGEAGAISALDAYAKALQIGGGTINTGKLTDKDLSSQEVLLELAKETSALSEKNAAIALEKLGIDEDVSRALHSGDVALASSLLNYKKMHPDIKAASDESRALTVEWARLKSKTDSVGESLLVNVAPALKTVESLLGSTLDYAMKHTGETTAAVGILGTALTAAGAVSFSGLLGGLGLVASGVSAAAVAVQALTLGLSGLAAWKGGTAIAEWLDKTFSLKYYKNGVKIEDQEAKDEELRKQYASKTVGGKTEAQLNAEIMAGGSGTNLGGVNGIKPNLNEKKGAGADIAQLKALGWTHEQASGIAANIQRESGGNEKAVGDGGKAYGLGQWHPDRQANFEKWAGKAIKDSTHAEQVAFINYELRQGTEQKAGAELSKATTAAQAGAIVSSKYERPADVVGEASQRSKLAESLSKLAEMLPKKSAEVAAAPVPTIDNALNTGAQAAVSSTQSNNAVSNNKASNNNQVATHINGPININAPQAKTGGDIASLIGEKLQTYTYGSMANMGLA